MKDKLLTSFKNLKPNQKGILVMLAIGMVLTLVGFATYFSNSRSPKTETRKSASTRHQPEVVNYEKTLLEKSELLEAQKDATLAKSELEEVKKLQSQLEKNEEAMSAGLLPPPERTSSPERTAAKRAQVQQRYMPPLPPPHNGGSSMGMVPPPPVPPQPHNSAPGMPPSAQPVVMESEIGGIALVENSRAGSDKNEKADKKKDSAKRSVFLPISYMEATLLSGLDAPTSTDAKGNPVPVLIRVKTPAVLPNDVKANLRGCFVVADGKGNLATERAELVLVSLSCVDRKGQSVIDQSLTGYVVDADGKAGLRGRVVTKMGAMITRSMLAGMFGGFGEALKAASTTTSLSAIGSVQSVKPEDVGWTGLGKGISDAFSEIQKFYMTLAHQTMPVVEIGAARPITLVVTKGVSLEIKKIKGGK